MSGSNSSLHLGDKGLSLKVIEQGNSDEMKNGSHFTYNSCHFSFSTL